MFLSLYPSIEEIMNRICFFQFVFQLFGFISLSGWYSFQVSLNILRSSGKGFSSPDHNWWIILGMLFGVSGFFILTKLLCKNGVFILDKVIYKIEPSERYKNICVFRCRKIRSLGN